MFYWKNNAQHGNIFLTHPSAHRFVLLQRFVLVGVCMMMFACDDKPVDRSLFYPLDSLVTDQIRYLAEAKATIKKTADVGGKKDVNTYTPQDTIGWIKELGVFRELDAINKPINHGAYLVDDGLTDIRSNLSVKAFTAKKEASEKQKLPVKYLRVFYHQSSDNLRRIEAEFNEETSLYKNTRHLSMEFQEVHNKIVLTSYSIEGGQKMYLGDSVHYAVEGIITLPN
jgi:hypothetical protein